MKYGPSDYDGRTLRWDMSFVVATRSPPPSERQISPIVPGGSVNTIPSAYSNVECYTVPLATSVFYQHPMYRASREAGTRLVCLLDATIGRLLAYVTLEAHNV